MPHLRVRPRTFLVFAYISAVTVVLNVVSGAAVRLSGSGLGCPDWPTCAHHHLTPVASFHPVIEFANRMVVFVLVVSCAATLVASFLRRPARSDLRWLSGGLILGVLAEAVLGAVVVYSKLNPYVVLIHFMIGIGLVAVGVLLVLRAHHAGGQGIPVVSSRARTWTWAYLVLLTLALLAGTGTTGAGPHAGGPGAKRIPQPLIDMARIHAETVIVTALCLLVLLWILGKDEAPAKVQDAGRILLLAMVLQGLLGYTQYFTHLPALLVGIHVAGATTIWCLAIWFQHGLRSYGPEARDGSAPAPESAAQIGVPA